MTLLRFLSAMITGLSIITVHAESVRIPTEKLQKHKLPDQMIAAAFARSDKYTISYPYGDIDALPMSTRINGVRNGQLDLFFALTTPEYEKEFITVPIPIYRGLLGWRLAIIKNGNADLFRNVYTLKDLQKFSAGQGTLWADTKILEANELKVVKEHKYTNLFRMLEADRFDYFPRGIHEPWLEVKREQDLNLMVDPYVVLKYKVPFYFFVSPQKPQLAEHLTNLLEEMLADGSFNELFFNNSEIKMVFAESNLSQRRIIALDNPFLTSTTPIHRDDLWVTAEEIQALSLSQH